MEELVSRSGKINCVVVGAGPAGLSAALELTRTGQRVVVLEQRRTVGGLARSISYHNCRFDVGPHRFYTKSRRVNLLWKDLLGDDFIEVSRLTRILYREHYFDYPLKILNTFSSLGLWLSLKAFGSYLSRPRDDGDSYEEYVTSAFGKVLFETFFKTYTEKIWGVPCSLISRDFACQRISGLSFWTAIKNAMLASRQGLPEKVRSLVAAFQYPKSGSGMMYDKMVQRIRAGGGEIWTGWSVDTWDLIGDSQNLVSVTASNQGEKKSFAGDSFISTVPINELIFSLHPIPSHPVVEAAHSLRFRDHISVNLVVEGENPFPDQWVYLHDPKLHAARVANYSNFSRRMGGQGSYPLTVEYFCFRDDWLWAEKNEDLIDLAVRELRSQKLINDQKILDGFVVREPDAYPIYFLNYQPLLQTVRSYLNGIKNLQLAGRAGLYRYNNMDHSLLTGLYAARNIMGESHDVWQVNTGEEYLEQVREQDGY